MRFALVAAALLLATPAFAQRVPGPLFDDREPDPRPDPEDAAAYAHADARKPVQDARAFPQQTTRNGGRPTDAPPEWVRPPAPDASIVAYWIDVYQGPRGIGWVAHYEILRGARTYRKSINFGPEKYREQDWTLVEVP